MGTLRRKPRRGQLSLLTSDEYDMRRLDEHTRAIGRRGVRASRVAVARFLLANADRAFDETSTSTIHEAVSARAGTYALDATLAREQQ